MARMRAELQIKLGDFLAYHITDLSKKAKNRL